MSKIKQYLKKNIYIAGLLVMTMFYSLKANLDSDLFWHMATGRWIIQHGQFISADPFSFVYRGAAWVDIPWLFQILTYGVHQALGYSGVLIFCGLFNACCVYFLWRIFKYLSPDEPLDGGAFFIFAFGLLFLDKRWLPRPEIFTYLFLAIEICILVQVFLFEQNKKLLWLLPLLQICWVNSHGMFVLGLIVFGAVWLSHPKKYLAPFLVTVLVTLINPNGWTGALYPFYLAQVTKDPVYNLIAEGRYLFSADTPRIFQIYWALWILLLPFSFKSGVKSLGRGYWLLCAFLLYFSTLLIRNLAPAVVITLPFIVYGIVSLAQKAFVNIQTKFLRIGSLVFTGIAVLLICSDSLSTIRFESYFGISIPPERLSTKAADFLIQNNIDHQVFAGAEFADYMLWADPHFESYIDTRFAEVVPKDHFILQNSIFASPKLLEQELANRQFNTVVLDHDNPQQTQSITYLFKSQSWHLVYLDQLIVIFTRNGLLDQIKIGPAQVDQIVEGEAHKYSQSEFHTTSQRFILDQYFGAAETLGRYDLASRLLSGIVSKDHFWPFLDHLCIADGVLLAGSNNSAEKARASCSDADRAHGSSYVSYFLALAYQRLNNPDQAIEAYSKAIAHGMGNYLPAQYQLAQLYEQKQNWPEAIQHYRACLALEDNADLRQHVEQLSRQHN